MPKVRYIPLNLHILLSIVTVVVPASLGVAVAQDRAGNSSHNAVEQKTFGDEISGMYTFLREGEFVQITVEEGKLSGFVSRYGERDSDKDAFLDQFFSKASLDGKKISFTTKPVHGTWFEFAGQVSRGEAKTPDKEGYWVIHGTLKEFDEDESKKVSSKSREATFKSFPQDINANQEPK